MGSEAELNSKMEDIVSSAEQPKAILTRESQVRMPRTGEYTSQALCAGSTILTARLIGSKLKVKSEFPLTLAPIDKVHRPPRPTA
jgi:hypothetical protein